MINKNKYQISHFLFLFLISLILVNFLPVNNQVIDTEIELGKNQRNTYLTVPITVNAVDGTQISKEQVEANIKKMNEIYNCEVIVFVWDGTINTIPDPDPGPADGAVIGRDDRDTVRDGSADVSEGKGVSITVTSDLGTSPTGEGINGYSIVGGNDGALVTNSTDGTTWAHEVQHSLGQSHGPESQADEDMDGDGDVDEDDTGWDANGDGRITPDDKNYNLWGRDDRTDNKISPYFHDMLYYNASSLPCAWPRYKHEILPMRPINESKDKDDIKGKRGTQTNLTGYFGDDANHTDIIRGEFSNDFAYESYFFWLHIGDMPIKNTSYYFMFDTQPGFGDPSPPFPDMDINITLSDETIISAWTGVEWMILYVLEPYNVTILNEEIDYCNETGSGISPDIDAAISLEINDPLIYAELALEGNFTSWIYSEWFDEATGDIVNDSTNLSQLTIENDPPPLLTLSDDEVIGGDIITINGTYFNPDNEVMIQIEGENITTIPTDPSGSFSENIPIPTKYNKTNAIITGIDEGRKIDGLYITIHGLDSDDDGLLDYDETEVHGTDPNDPDSDGDGISDGDEISQGTDPNDPNDPGTTTPPIPSFYLYYITLIITIVIIPKIWKRRKNIK